MEARVGTSCETKGRRRKTKPAARAALARTQPLAPTTRTDRAAGFDGEECLWDAGLACDRVGEPVGMSRRLGAKTHGDRSHDLSTSPTAPSQRFAVSRAMETGRGRDPIPAPNHCMFGSEARVTFRTLDAGENQDVQEK